MKDGLGRPQTMLVLGAGSDIARAAVQGFASQGLQRVLLAAREPGRLEGWATSLPDRVDVQTRALEATAFDTHEAFVDDAFELLGDVDLVLLTFGVLPDQAAARHDPEMALEAARVNYLGAMSLLIPIADRMRQDGHGDIVVLSSVSAERGRGRTTCMDRPRPASTPSARASATNWRGPGATS